MISGKLVGDELRVTEFYPVSDQNLASIRSGIPNEDRVVQVRTSTLVPRLGVTMRRYPYLLGSTVSECFQSPVGVSHRMSLVCLSKSCEKDTFLRKSRGLVDK